MFLQCWAEPKMLFWLNTGYDFNIHSHMFCMQHSNCQFQLPKARKVHMLWYPKVSGATGGDKGSELLPVSMCLWGWTLHSYPWEKPPQGGWQNRPLSFSCCSRGSAGTWKVLAALLCLSRTTPPLWGKFWKRLITAWFANINQIFQGMQAKCRE